jgi:predicted murein hydrolase (TIGR00659 family)
MNELLNTPAFGIIISTLFFITGTYIYNKSKITFLNPLLISISSIICFLYFFKIPYSSYEKGGNFISLFLAPSTILLAVPLYNRFYLLKKHFKAIIIGTIVGSFVSVSYIFIICKLLKIKKDVFLSLLPKSVTTPIAIEITKNLNGVVPITVVAVIITGIIGAIVSESILKFFKIKDKVAVGIAIGTASHAVGTSKAVEIGETEGAMSGLAIGIVGVITVVISPIIALFY